MQKIEGYLPADDGLKKALTGSDVVIIPAGIPREQDTTFQDGRNLLKSMQESPV